MSDNAVEIWYEDEVQDYGGGQLNSQQILRAHRLAGENIKSIFHVMDSSQFGASIALRHKLSRCI